MIVMPKPMHVTIVSVEPRHSAVAACDTRAEKSGESATTEIPQRHKNESTNKVDVLCSKIGDNKQHTQEMDNAQVATFFSPNR